MKYGMRTPSIKKSFKARTTGRLNRAIRSSYDPTYQKKGVGYIKDPSKAIYNNYYKRTTRGISDMQGGSNIEFEDGEFVHFNTHLKEKDRKTAILLCIFLGYFGIHKFYEGKIGMRYFIFFHNRNIWNRRNNRLDNTITETSKVLYLKKEAVNRLLLFMGEKTWSENSI